MVSIGLILCTYTPITNRCCSIAYKAEAIFKSREMHRWNVTELIKESISVWIKHRKRRG